MTDRRKVWDRLVRPDGSPVASAPVTIETIPEPAYDVQGKQTIIRAAVTTTDETGRWEAEVRPTDQLAPYGVQYRVSVPLAAGALYRFRVPTGDLSAIWVGDLQDLEPGGPPPGGGGGGGARVVDLVRDTTATGKLGAYRVPGDDMWHPWPGGPAFDLQWPAAPGQICEVSAFVTYLPSDAGAIYLACGVVDTDGNFVADIDNGNPFPSGKAMNGVGFVAEQPIGTTYFVYRTAQTIRAEWLANGLLTVRFFVRNSVDTDWFASPTAPATFWGEVYGG